MAQDSMTASRVLAWAVVYFSAKRYFSGPSSEEVVHGTTLCFLNWRKCNNQINTRIMKKEKHLVVAIFVAAICSSCASTFEKVNQTMVRVQEPEVGTVATPIVMELGEIPQQKITDTTVINVNDYRRPTNASQTYQRITQSMLVDFRKEALENAVLKHDCDVIVYPSFRIKTSDDGKTCYVIVSGYPAKYKRIRPATKDDLWMLEFMGKGENFFINNVRYEEDVENRRPSENRRPIAR